MGKIAAGASSALVSLRVLGEAGVIRPYSPKKLVGLGATLRRWGTGPAGGFISLAVRAPHAVGLVDELGELTWSELDSRTNALAHALRGRGVAQGGSVALMCRNHRGFVETSIAVAKLGADALYLNTAFAGPQLTEVLERSPRTSSSTTRSSPSCSAASRAWTGSWRGPTRHPPTAP